MLLPLLARIHFAVSMHKTRDASPFNFILIIYNKRYSSNNGISNDLRNEEGANARALHLLPDFISTSLSRSPPSLCQPLLPPCTPGSCTHLTLPDAATWFEKARAETQAPRPRAHGSWDDVWKIQNIPNLWLSLKDNLGITIKWRMHNRQSYALVFAKESGVADEKVDSEVRRSLTAGVGGGE